MNLSCLDSNTPAKRSTIGQEKIGETICPESSKAEDQENKYLRDSVLKGSYHLHLRRAWTEVLTQW